MHVHNHLFDGQDLNEQWSSLKKYEHVWRLWLDLKELHKKMVLDIFKSFQIDLNTLLPQTSNFI